MLFPVRKLHRKNEGIARLRSFTQLAFLILVLVLGFQFWRFVRYYETAAYLNGGTTPVAAHQSGVEAFLPIGGLTSLRYWWGTGEIHPAHPAALILFLAAVLVSLVLRKAFCGWVCPVGFLSEWVYRPWKKYFGKNVQLPKWLDYPLRAVKYLLLGFFLWAIGYAMSVTAARAFLDSDYWKVADVKMLRFFTEISPTALIVMGGLTLLSIPIRNFWCRYLCPYGALLGLAGSLSPFAIRRDDELCRHCRKCTRNCPAHLPVEASRSVLSPECTSCLTCVSGCPAGALSYSTPRRFSLRRELSGYGVLTTVLTLFFGLILLAKISGNWKAGIPEDDLKRLIPEMSELAHPR